MSFFKISLLTQEATDFRSIDIPQRGRKAANLGELPRARMSREHPRENIKKFKGTRKRRNVFEGENDLKVTEGVSKTSKGTSSIPSLCGLADQAAPPAVVPPQPHLKSPPQMCQGPSNK